MSLCSWPEQDVGGTVRYDWHLHLLRLLCRCLRRCVAGVRCNDRRLLPARSLVSRSQRYDIPRVTTPSRTGLFKCMTPGEGSDVSGDVSCLSNCSVACRPLFVWTFGVFFVVQIPTACFHGNMSVQLRSLWSSVASKAGLVRFCEWFCDRERCDIMCSVLVTRCLRWFIWRRCSLLQMFLFKASAQRGPLSALSRVSVRFALENRAGGRQEFWWQQCRQVLLNKQHISGADLVCTVTRGIRVYLPGI